MKLINTINILISLTIVFASGCATVHKVLGWWDEKKENPVVVQAQDDVDYSQFKWVYGGFNGKNAVSDGVQISNLKIYPHELTFSYDANLSAWRFSDPTHCEFACAFVQKADSTWVGGKFDWISTSRTKRDFENIFTHYNGWNIDDIPNPCKFAFVIVEGNSKRRSNVLLGEWYR